MINKKIWIFGKNSVLSLLSEEKRKIYEIQVLNPDLLKSINKKYLSLCKIVNKKQFLKNLDVEIAHQGICACVDDVQNNKIENLNDHTIILDNVSDHRNIGSIIRSSIAFGINNIIINKKDFSSGSQLMHKTASGAVEKMNFYQVTNISNSLNILKKKGFIIIGFDGNSNLDIYQKKDLFLEKKIAFIFGSEESGLRELTKKNSDYILKIPIKNIESLNVSNAVTSVMTFYNYLISFKESKKLAE